MEVAEENNTSTSVDKMELCIDRIHMRLLERNAFTKPKLNFPMRISDIPPIIPSRQRKKELNTEMDKKSVYLKDHSTTVEGQLLFHYRKRFQSSNVKIKIVLARRHCKLTIALR